MKSWFFPVLLSLTLHFCVLFLIPAASVPARASGILLRAQWVSLPAPPALKPSPAPPAASPSPASPTTKAPVKKSRVSKPSMAAGESAIPRETAQSGPAEEPKGTGKPEPDTTGKGPPTSPAVKDTLPRELSPGDVIVRNKPLYPLASRRKGESGTVVLLVHLDVQGKVAEIEVHASSGYPALDRAALSSVKSWGFRMGAPALVLVPVVFRLE